LRSDFMRTLFPEPHAEDEHQNAKLSWISFEVQGRTCLGGIGVTCW
jgi:hypothetical protein